MSKSAGHSRSIFSLSLLCALAIGPSLASDVSDGLKQYNQGKYESARKAFQKALITNKEDPRLHYCLANTLMHLHKVEEALREYHLCIHYGPGTIISEQSEAAIGAYEQHAQPFDREKAAAEKREAELRREEEQRQQASERIHRQAELHAGLRSSDAEGQRNAILSSASANAKRIRDDAEEAANNQSYVYRRRYWARQNAADIRKQAKEDSDALLKRAQQQAEEYDRDARERANRMSEAESNLNSQMLQPISGGKMRLVPTGTNLYIRNYK